MFPSTENDEPSSAPANFLNRYAGSVSTLVRVSRMVVESVRDIGIGALTEKGIRAYWSKGVRRGFGNFGDEITPFLIHQYGYYPVHMPPRFAKLVLVGSVLHKLPEHFQGSILGAGLIQDRPHSLPSAHVLGVRGALTRNLLGLSPSIALGDPGLLVRRLIDPPTDADFLLGIVPHYRDQSSPTLTTFARQHCNDVKVIDVLRDPSIVIDEIRRCSVVASSSLHGLVVADALGIPNAWTTITGLPLGRGFKYRDYYSAFEEERHPIQLTTDTRLSQLLHAAKTPSPRIESIVERLHSNLQSLLRDAVAHGASTGR